MDCGYAGITGVLESLDLSGLSPPVTKLTISGPYGLSYRYNTFTSLGASFITGVGATTRLIAAGKPSADAASSEPISVPTAEPSRLPILEMEP